MERKMEENMRDVDAGSEAGGEDALVGNVNKLMVTPPGYTGVPRKGHLVFDACFESGNLGRVDYISEFEFDLFIRPDTCNPRFRVWFNFTVENVRETQRVIFNIVNFSKTKSLYRDGMSPVVKSTSRPKWQRLPTKNVYYYRCPDHRRNYVMSFAFCFDREDDVYQFAYCYPYTYTRLQHYLDSLERRNLDYLQREQLGLSVQQRRLDLLTITSPAQQNPEKVKKLVVLTARVHPGESPASFICQGVIDFLVSQHPVAQTLRDHVIFKIVPMLNPDGVYLGNYRCSLMGFDLNRHWQEPSPWAHPTLHAVKQLIVQLSQDPVGLEFYIDVHAHSTMMNGFMYGNVFEEEERVQRQAVFPRLLCQNAPDFSFSNTSFNRDVVKAGTGRRFLGGLLDDTSYCYTLEVSFYSYMAAGSTSPVPYTEDTYMKLGRNVARTFLDYYRHNNFIDDNKLQIPNHINSMEVLSQGRQGNGNGNGRTSGSERGAERKNQSITGEY
ncbi:cytosolic carboxypeptidase 6 [Salvelinus alpinus]|nr:cytosolic carboxypeptidase 6 [Oncorhynchus mykiss]XP_023859712.1 cytosolic carboxypeptidase 6 isoform X7 [Salvelinus alpinus]XP_035637775.1 cytosolic carboxypeptidase 6 [Oncorhynchus keta]XP_055717214.1 cytosolic carboxypeptidase 6-like [Salvelinus fontinalis]